MKRTLSQLLTLLLLVLLGCQNPDPETPPAEKAMDTIDKLLDLHDLAGKTQAQRSPEAENRPVDEVQLNSLFLDYSETEPFLANLYVGFVVGALARQQQALVMTKRGSRVVVHAGKVSVVMTVKDGRWVIDLEKSIPEIIRKRAEQERARFNRQKVARASVSPDH